MPFACNLFHINPLSGGKVKSIQDERIIDQDLSEGVPLEAQKFTAFCVLLLGGVKKKRQ